MLERGEMWGIDVDVGGVSLFRWRNIIFQDEIEIYLVLLLIDWLKVLACRWSNINFQEEEDKVEARFGDKSSLPIFLSHELVASLVIKQERFNTEKS